MEKRYVLMLGCVLAMTGSSWAARRVDANARAMETMKRRRETAAIKREEPGTLDTTELLQLTKGESMKELRRATDAHGTTVERMEEEYQGIPVFDSTVTVRKDEHGHLTGDASGVLFQDIADDLPDTKPKLSDEETLEIVIAAEGDENMRDLISDVQYFQYIFMDATQRARLVNSVTYLIDGEKRPVYIIDLKSGEILQHWNAFMTIACCKKSPLKARLFGGNEKMGKIWYGSQPYCLDFTVDECNQCYLENKYVRVVDMKQSRNHSHHETASFPCNEIYGDEVNGGYSPAIDAYFHGTIVGKMFEEWYNSTVLNSKMIIRVHYGANYRDAFWNGKNATFGDGGFFSYPLTTMDIVGHEFGHGVVGQGSDLLYFSESGGVNEAFADIMGVATEAYFLKSDFLIGNNVEKYAEYMREFEVPERDKESIGRADQMKPNMDPHLSSGVYRRIWHVIVQQQQINVKDAFKVFIYANKMYWHYKSTFYDVSCGLLRAAMDLGMDTRPFAIAFEDVGILPCNVSGHIFTLSNNKTQRGITVSETIQPIFGFAMPIWGTAVTIEAISPSGGSVYITLNKGSWEDEEYDIAEILDSGYGKLVYNLKSTVNETYGYGYSRRDLNGGSTLNDTYETSPVNETYPYEYTTPRTDIAEDYHFFIKLSLPGYWYYEYDDVELTVGYICDDNFVTAHSLMHEMYRFYCYGEY